jgi:hypothetical protein
LWLGLLLWVFLILCVNKSTINVIHGTGLVADASARLDVRDTDNVLLDRIIDTDLFIVSLLGDGSWRDHHLNYGEK